MESIQHTTLLDLVTETLRNAILDGELKLGERINESAYTAKFDISRSTFREAMRQLEQAGLLVRVPFKGTFVREFSEEEIRDLNQLRGVLEKYAAEILIEGGRNTLENMKPLYEVVAQMEGIDPEADVTRTNQLHITFHRILVDMAGNQLLYSVWNDLAQQFWVAMRVSQLSFISSGEADSFSEAHRQVVDAIAAGDKDQVRRIIDKHVS